MKNKNHLLEILKKFTFRIKNVKAKFYVLAIFILLGLFYSFTTVNKKNNPENDLVEITPLIENTIRLYDSTKLDAIKHGTVSRTMYLSYPEFNALKKQLKQTFNDSNALIYSDPEKDKLDLKERKNIINTQKTLTDDSTHFWKNIDVLGFFESWYYNKGTGEVVKKQLGYAIAQYDYNKEAVRHYYYYFTSTDARKKYIKNW